MPLPTPKADETRDDFIARCMKDAAIVDEFPEDDQRLAVCGNLFDRAGDMDRAALHVAAGNVPPPSILAHFRKQPEGAYSWDVEVFAAGTWNGYRFTVEDLDKIVESYQTLHGGGYLDAPLKMGHNDEQPLTDGAPALGYVERLYRKGDKLLATFADVPKLVYDAAKAKRYRKVSVELDFDVRHKGTLYPYVMTGIALLGADLPAVNTLADLTAYMGRGSLAASRRACFSAIAVTDKPNPEGRKMATIDDKELEALRLKAAKADTLSTEVAEFKRKDTERKDAEKKAAITAARDSVNKRLDDAVTAMQITPAQRAGFARVLRVDDDEAVTAIKPEDVDAVLPEKKDADKGAAFGKGDRQPNDGAPGDDTGTDAEVDAEVRKIMAGNSSMTYTTALDRLCQVNPDLMRRHYAADAVN